ncbi:hypothetical protein HEK131_32380 [Streptomyces seoulensis]|nr:hypothetical protein HEK131_32380 [Streptomyces seoulensis]
MYSSDSTSATSPLSTAGMSHSFHRPSNRTALTVGPDACGGIPEAIPLQEVQSAATAERAAASGPHRTFGRRTAPPADASRR